MARLDELSSSQRGGQDSFEQMFTAYMLRSLSAKKSYVGMTDNLQRRLKEHNSGKHFYTKRYVPWAILHKEKFDTLTEARAREVYLKSTSGRRFLKKLFASLASAL